ncbi:hypothetical protein BJF79_23685 [Actinomadura sp. CNU-125]|uniref:hypothetical protein n=1 Tax=Actinomadura sp. CNU-125 TaxID=1904961 RepID=UPI00095FAF14|nr:hypothetical protein [Actinomadura sp. CNU-125]OLT11725.1 hypothetical protein BJF79_23685 [Actinomadura sp. CNU-125]
MTEDADPGDMLAPRHCRPHGASDAAVAAAGRISEALETTERARGHLYSFHQLTGRADAQLDDAVTLLRAAGYSELADRMTTEVIGRNVVPGRWTFQLVEEYDEGYYQMLRRLEQDVRDTLMAGRRHVHEAEMKEQRRTPGMPGHEATPEGRS